MLEKYNSKFKEMHEEITTSKRDPIEVIRKHFSLFREEGIGILGILHYLEKYINEKRENYLSQ